MSDKTEVTPDNIEKPTETEAKILVKEAETKNGAENRAENKPIKTPENEEAMEAPEDLGSIIDSGLSEVVLGKPFARTSKLTYDESLGLIRFAQKDYEVVFRMPQRTKELDLVSPFEKDKFEAFFVDSLKVIFDEKKLGRS
ncbi:hypothetical protein Tco_0127675 [Tanacetum coccineum]